MPLDHAAVDLAFITADDAKVQHICAHNGLPWGGATGP